MQTRRGRPSPANWSQRQFNSMSPTGSWPTALPILRRGSKSVWRTLLPQHWRKKNAELVTGDPEFKPLEKEIEISWLKGRTTR
jgi:hypothetical protein